MSIDNRIRELRMQQGMTLQQLAEKVGCSYQQIMRLELGQRRLSHEWMERIAKSLSCRPSALIEELSSENGFSEALIPFQIPPENSRNGRNIVKVEGKFYLTGQTAESEKTYALEMKDNSLNLSGILAGDIIISDMDAIYKAGDIVIMQHYSDDGAETIMRKYDPPLLFPHSTEHGYANFKEGDEKIRIVSPVIKVVRMLG